MEPINKWILIAIEMLISLYAIVHGWLILKRGEVYITPAHRIGLVIVDCLFGSEAAKSKRNKLTNPRFLISLGKQMIIVGILFLIVTIITLFQQFS